MPPRKSYRPVTVLFLVLFISQVHIYAQMEYNDIKKEQKELVLDEQFNSNQSNWILEKNGEIANGQLIVDAKGNTRTDRSAFMALQIDQSRDFEIETSFAYHNKDGGFSIVIGQTYWNFQTTYIGFNRVTQFWVGENTSNNSGFHPEKQAVIFEVKKISINKESESNKFTIRKIGKTYHYFINEAYVAFAPFKTMTEQKVGFYVSGRWINVEYLSVCYLLKNDQFFPETNNVPPNRTNNSPDGLKPIKSEIKQNGKYYSLVIGVSKYDESKLNLDKPVKDAEKIKEVFVKRYSFTDSTCFLLLNPTRQKIISELYRLRKIIGPSDNLLIFYAGHGFWDEDARQGYWWAKDAMTDDPSTWLSNSDLREQIRSIKSAHTLLISDACFSGGIFKTRSGNEIQNATRDIQLLYSIPSRRAMTSGTMTAVPDNSVFLQYLLKRLTENQAKFLSAQQLFDSFRAAVINNSNVVPQDGVIADTGDEGGDFIFILKE